MRPIDSPEFLEAFKNYQIKSLTKDYLKYRPRPEDRIKNRIDSETQKLDANYESLILTKSFEEANNEERFEHAIGHCRGVWSMVKCPHCQDDAMYLFSNILGFNLYSDIAKCRKCGTVYYAADGVVTREKKSCLAPVLTFFAFAIVLPFFIVDESRGCPYWKALLVSLGLWACYLLLKLLRRLL